MVKHNAPHYIIEPPQDKTNKMGVCPAKAAWASPQSDQSLLHTQWVAKDPSFLNEDSKDSDQADAQADLCLRWAHMPFC